MKPLLLVTLLLIFSSSVLGQKTVSELNPKHATSLEQFLSKNKQYQFLSETAFNQESLKEARKYFGGTLTPYYRVGDFNRDGVPDFAIVLSKKGASKQVPGVTSEPHKYMYPLALVVFNGNKNGTFRNAFVKEMEEPLVCFLDLTSGKEKRLTFGVFETDSGFALTPVGRGYIIEYPEEF